MGGESKVTQRIETVRCGELKRSVIDRRVSEVSPQVEPPPPSSKRESIGAESKFSVKGWNPKS